MPPSLVRAAPTPGETVVLDEDGTVVYIIISDPDDAEAVTFTWSMTDEGILPGAQTIPDGATRRASQLRLSPDVQYDGEVLTVRAFDGASNVLEYSWPVVVDVGDTQ